MKTVSNPPLLSLGSAACHIRSSPPTCAAPGLGGPNVVPPSFDLPTVMLAAVRLEYARPESVGVPKPTSVAASIGLALVDGISETTRTNAVPSARMRPMRPPSAQKNFGDAGCDSSRDALATRCMTGARTRARSLGRSTFRRRSREGQRQGNSSALVLGQDRTFIWF